MNNSCFFTISFFNQTVVKNERGKVNFPILYPMIYADIAFKSVSPVNFYELKKFPR